MYKIKLLILLFSLNFIFGCSNILKNTTNDIEKISLNYSASGQNSFIFEKIFLQELLINELYDKNSKYILTLNMAESNEYSVASISKVSNRQSLYLTVNATLTNQNEKYVSLNNEKAKVVIKNHADLNIKDVTFKNKTYLSDKIKRTINLYNPTTLLELINLTQMNDGIALKVIEEIKPFKGCILSSKSYSVNQNYVLASSSANLSNTAAIEEIFQENVILITEKIIDDLLYINDFSCI